MPSGSFIIGDSTAYTFSVSSGGTGTYIRCSTTSSVASQTNLAVNDTNFPADPSTGNRWVKLQTMSVTKNTGTATYNVFTGTTSNTTSNGGVLPVLSQRSYYDASTGLTYGVVFTSSGSLSLFRTNFSGGTVDTNVSTTTLPGNLRATFTYYTLPYAPGTPSASVNGQTVSVSWSAPSNNGGTSVQSYRIWMSTNGGSFQYLTEQSGTSYSFTGTLGNTYAFRVAAITTMIQNLRTAESIPNATGPQSSSSNTVTVAATTGIVPNVIGQDEFSAISDIEFEGFVAVKGTNVTTGATALNNGTVASQTPSGGTTANLGSNVTYRLYAFTSTTVPAVVGDTEATAVSEIEAAGLVASISYSSVGATVGNNGTVKSQSPASGSTATPGSTVNIVVYSYSLGLGKRMTGASTSTSIATAKRFDGTDWVDLTIARRFDGTNWINFTN